ncbi:MAG: hypothetical protein ABSB22_12325 [Thermodesulfobacteriota bacterium]
MKLFKNVSRDFLFCLILFFLVFIGHLVSRNITSVDSKWSIPTAMSIIKEGNTHLDEYGEILQKNNYSATQEIDGHYYSIFPVGVSLLAVPFVYASEKMLDSLLPLIRDLARYQGHDLPGTITVISIAPGIELFVASVIIAVTTVFIYLIAHGFLDRQYAFLISLVFAFCTSAWSTASRGLWQHGPSMLMLTITLYLILRGKNNPRLLQFASIPLAFSYVIRPTNCIPVVLLTVFMVVYHRQHFLRYILWALVIAVPFVIFNLSIYRSLLSPYYYLSHSFRFDLGFLWSLAGHLISPSRGLLIYSPILMFSIYGIAAGIKKGEFKPLDWFLLLILFVHWIVISSFSNWWGGFSFGPRYFADMIPYWIYFLILGVARILQYKGMKKIVLVSIFVCLVGISFFVHYRGANDWDVYRWNSEPIDVDAKPERVWEWNDIQFLRGVK